MDSDDKDEKGGFGAIALILHPHTLESFDARFLGLYHAIRAFLHEIFPCLSRHDLDFKVDPSLPNSEPWHCDCAPRPDALSAA